MDRSILYKYNYPSIGDNDFNTIIGSKREFRDLTLSEEQPEEPENKVLFNHQRIIERFFSSHTPYDELLLFHQPGTGKTITAINIVEKLIDNKVYKKAYIIVPNKTISRQFMNEVIYSKATGGKYKAELTEEELLRYDEAKQADLLFGRAKFRSTYRFKTHETFYNDIKGLAPNQLKQMYSHSLFIVDEAHRILSRSDWETTYKTFFRTCTPRKVLLMTGTPMKNDATDIISLMNLILPVDYNDNFKSDDSGSTDDKIKQFKEICVGRISYLKSKSTIPVEFFGKHFNLPFNLFFTTMGTKQKENYDEIKQEGEQKTNVFYRPQLQAALIFEKGFERELNTLIQVDQSLLDKQSIHKNITDNLQKLSNYSGKYAAVIEQIITNLNQNVFVYTSSINDAGAVLFGRILEKFGYTQATNMVGTPGHRYAILSDSIAKNKNQSNNIKNILRTFNSLKNATGDYIQVLIGGKQIEEGVTFLSIQQLHIVTPPWNYATLDQIIARCVRTQSHRYLPKESKVSVFLHASANTEDIKLYEKGYEKDKLIKQVEFALKQVAFDCPFTKPRNMVINNTSDGSRMCEYKECKYTCDAEYKREVDENTYELFYQDEYLPYMVKTLNEVFRKQTSVSFFDIIHLFRTYNTTKLLQAVTRIIQEQIPFTDKYGCKAYLHEDNNFYFLSYNAIRTSYTDAFYVENPACQNKRPFLTLVSDVLESPDALKESLDNLNEKKADDSEFINTVKTFPPIVQEGFIEVAIEHDLHEQQQNVAKEDKNTRVEQILTQYNEYIYVSKDSGSYSTFMKFNSETNKVRIFKNDKWMTIDSKQDEAESIEQMIDSEKYIFGVRLPNKSFKIINVLNVPDDKRKSKQNIRGKVCNTHQVTELVDILNYYDIPYNITKKSVLCGLIDNYFVENDLMIGDITSIQT